jgi:hypothetical protein
MKQIILLTIIGLAMLAAAGCVSPAVNTPTPTSVPTSVSTPYAASPVVSYYPTPVPTNVTAYYNVSGSVVITDVTALNGYTVALACYGNGGVSDQYSGLTDANGSYKISFSSPKGYYDNFTVTVISPSKQLVYHDIETRPLTGNDTADVAL